jgi:hypothetical protein
MTTKLKEYYMKMMQNFLAKFNKICYRMYCLYGTPYMKILITSKGAGCYASRPEKSNMHIRDKTRE